MAINCAHLLRVVDNFGYVFFTTVELATIVNPVYSTQSNYSVHLRFPLSLLSVGEALNTFTIYRTLYSSFLLLVPGTNSVATLSKVQFGAFITRAVINR